MFSPSFCKRLVPVLLCLLCILLAACGGAASPPNVDNGHAGSLNGPSTPLPKGPLSSTVPMPPTSTSCPQPALSGRAAITRTLMLGNGASIVYINDQGTAPGANSFGELKLYDTVTGGANGDGKDIGMSSTIVHIPQAIITEAQVSNNGQWLLFVTQTPSDSEIQMARMDGQGLQTLYCAPPGTVHSIQWSPDGSRIIFSQEAISGLWNLFLFSLTTGQVQPELVQSNAASSGYEVRTWFDNNRVYVVEVPNPPTSSPTRSLFVLDTSRGPDQQPSDLLPIMQPSQAHSCWSFDSDYNSTELITSQCNATFSPASGDLSAQQGPSSISVQGITGGAQRTIYSSRQEAITQVRMLGYSSDTLLMCINTIDSNNPMDATAGLNGLWKINLNGSGLKALASTGNGNECEFNQFSQYPWANISLDNQLYSLEAQQVLGKSASTSLAYGPLNGGPAIIFANGSANQGLLAVAGWTKM